MSKQKPLATEHTENTEKTFLNLCVLCGDDYTLRGYNEGMQTLKEHFLLDPQIHFLNHGSFGATPKPVFAAYQRWQTELEKQPVEFLGRRYNDLMQSARRTLGGYFNTSAENLVFTTNVTVSMNIVAHSLDLKAGDEVLSSNHEYGACDRMWRFLSKERGFTYINQPIETPLTTNEKIIEDLWKGVTPRTKIIFISHISSATAIIFPIAEICKRAHEAGILTVIDGAHAAGQIPLDLDALGADFYGGNLHKWLCAPKGAGYLYAHPRVQDLLKPLIVSWGYESETPSGSTFIDYFEWFGTRDNTACLCVEDAIQFQKTYSWDVVRRECHALLRGCLERACTVSGLAPLYPLDSDFYAQMGVLPLPDSVDLDKFKIRLYDEFKIEAPIIFWNNKKFLRISVQGYNTQADIDALINALKILIVA